MPKYYKLYHYSKNAALTSIDPAYYGTGVSSFSELKKGKRGGNKSFFYTRDEPEQLLSSGTRYEIYLPYEWKVLIYDLGKDPLDFYGAAKRRVAARGENPEVMYLVYDAIEELLKEAGYKGFCNTRASLTHVACLFYPLSTAKPLGLYTVYDFNTDKLIQDPGNTLFAFFKFLFASQPKPAPMELKNNSVAYKA